MTSSKCCEEALIFESQPVLNFKIKRHTFGTTGTLRAEKASEKRPAPAAAGSKVRRLWEALEQVWATSSCFSLLAKGRYGGTPPVLRQVNVLFSQYYFIYNLKLMMWLDLGPYYKQTDKINIIRAREDPD